MMQSDKPVRTRILIILLLALMLSSCMRRPVIGLDEAITCNMEELSEEVLERIASRLKAMGNPFRLKILQALHEGEMSVNEILSRVGGSQANVSKHLNVLRGADLVKSRREGVSVFYTISDASVFSICETVCDSLLHQASREVARIARGRAGMLGGKG